MIDLVIRRNWKIYAAVNTDCTVYGISFAVGVRGGWNIAETWYLLTSVIKHSEIEAAESRVHMRLLSILIHI